MAIKIPSNRIYGEIKSALLKNNVITSTSLDNATYVTENKFNNNYEYQFFNIYDPSLEMMHLTPTHYYNVEYKIHRFPQNNYNYIKYAVITEVIKCQGDFFVGKDISKFEFRVMYDHWIAAKKYNKLYSEENETGSFIPLEQFDDEANFYEYNYKHIVGYEFIDSRTIKLKYIIYIFWSAYSQANSTDYFYGNYTVNLKTIITSSEAIVNKEARNCSYDNVDTNSMNKYKLESNELYQRGAKYISVDLFLSNSFKILYNYSKGRKSATLTVAYDSYKDDVGTTVYTGLDGKTIKCGDKVIPYKRRNGVDVPLLTDSNGKPKEFLVTSSEIVYDGSIKINLEILEDV